MNPIVFIILDLLLAGLSIPLIFERVPRNEVYGFRFPVALKNDENWFRMNRFGGRCLAFTSLLSLVWLVALWASSVQTSLLLLIAFILPAAATVCTAHAYSKHLA